MNTVWESLLGLSWLDIGNGWRNLFLLSCLLQAGALGALFAIRGWFSPASRAACFLTGAAATPFVQYLWTLLLAFVWPHAPRLVYIGVLPGLACLYGLYLLLRHFRKIPSLLVQGLAFARRILTFDKAALIALCFALALAVLLAPVLVRFATNTESATPGDSGEYLGLAVRFCEDRDIEKLLEKEETIGHFRGHGHFPSLELYMSYGLMYTEGTYGYPYDKPVFTGLGLLAFYMIAAYAALLLVLTGERKRWVLLGILLLNLVPNLYFSVNGAPRDIWRILALILAALFFAGLCTKTREKPRKRNTVLKILASFGVCFTVMSAHVVCFVVLPFIVVAWVLARLYQSLQGPHPRGDFLRSVGIALGGAAGTLVAFLGNLWCFFKWGEMSPWRLMTTYTSAPWYEAYMLGEYKLEETTTSLHFWKDRYDIVMAYATPVGLWGLRLAAAALLMGVGWLCWRRFHSDKRLDLSAPKAASPMPIFAALLTLCTLAPMSGLLDTKLYSFSGSFIALQRYTLQWYLFAAAMICAALAALEAVWPALCGWAENKWAKASARMQDTLMCKLWKIAPAILCAVLCVLAFSQGVKQTGYANSFYRYSRNVMGSESASLDFSFLERYGLLMTAARHVPEDQKILLTRPGYQYALRGRGYILTANPIVPLMNLPLADIPAALEDMGAVMLATEPDFWDERYYALSTLSEYLSAFPAEQIVQDDSHMRLYILDADIARALAAEIEEAAAPQ